MVLYRDLTTPHTQEIEMALRAERILNDHEKFRLRAMTDLLAIHADYDAKRVTGEMFNTVVASQSAILGTRWLQALAQAATALDYDADQVNALVRDHASTGRRTRLVGLMDKANELHRAEESKRYLASLRRDPEALAEALKACTGANIVTVTYERPEDGSQATVTAQSWVSAPAQPNDWLL